MFNRIKGFIKRSGQVMVSAFIGGTVLMTTSAYSAPIKVTDFSTADALANVALVGIAVLGVKVASYGLKVAKSMIS